MPDDHHLAAAPPVAPPPARTVRSVVVVGAGLAGAQTVAALRAQGFDGRVTLLGRETTAPYDRPPLSKHLLDRPEPAWLTDELGVDAHALADDVHVGMPADRLVIQADGVTVRAGEVEVRADAVVVATGSRAVLPAAWRDAVTLHTADDAARLRSRLVPGARLVIIGAGWIGAEVAGVAAAAGVDVTVVEATTAPLSAALGGRVGDLTRGWYASAGVRLELGAEVTAVAADGVRLADGRRLPADVVLAAVGARPDTQWLDGTLPRDPDGSLRVDAWHRVVGMPGPVRAVGDVARRWSPRHGWVAGGHWDGALRGPATAVRGLLGGPGTGGGGERVPVTVPVAVPGEVAGEVPVPVPVPVPDDPAPYVFSTQLGHDLTLYGQQQPGDDLVLRGDPAGGEGWGALWFAAPGSDGVAGGPAVDGVAGGPAVDGVAGEPGSDGAAGDLDLDEAAGTTTSGRGRVLTAMLAVDRPRDVAAARRLFTGTTLPLLDPEVAADGTRQLRDAVVR